MKRLCLLLAVLAIPVLCRADPAGILVSEPGGTVYNIYKLITPAGSQSVASGVLTIDNATTAALGGAIPFITSTTGVTLTTAQGYGYMVWATGAGDVDLPDVCDSATGANVCVYVRDAAETVSVTTPAEDLIVYPGIATLIANDELDSPGLANDFVCLACMEADKWYWLGGTPNWTDGGAAD